MVRVAGIESCDRQQPIVSSITAIKGWLAMFCRAVLLCLFMVSPIGQAAGACRLDHASYQESRSGATIQFRPKDNTAAGGHLIGLFQMRLPNVSEVFEGNIRWDTDRYPQPDGAIERECYPDEDDESGTCWLWTGNVYNLDSPAAVRLRDANMMAPKAISLADFGQSFAMSEILVRANPHQAADDVFTLVGCVP
jgi:hypothetical protein